MLKRVQYGGIDTYSKDVVEFLQRPLLCLRHEEEDHDEGDNVEAGVETESTNGVEAVDQEREGDTEESGKTQASSDGETHTKLTVRQREDLGRVGKRNRTLTGRVESGEQVNEEGN